MTPEAEEVPHPRVPELALSEGTTTAVACICAGHAPLLRAIARGKFGIPEAEVDDLVQDVFATFLTYPARVQDLRAYLIGGICNAAREYWRRQKQDERLFLGVDDASLLTKDVLESVTTALTLNRVLSRLDERCRSVLMRYYLDGEESSSIATSIGTSRRNVNYILHVCRKRVRTIFRQIGHYRQ